MLDFPLAVLWPAETWKHRMFAVLLWALRVHTFSAAARFSFTRYADFVPDSVLSCGHERGMDVLAMGEC